MKRLFKIISFGTIGVLVAVLIAATLIENIYGSSFAIDGIYHSTWFIAVWALLAVTSMAYILCVSKRRSLILLHASLVLVLLGAFVSFMTSKRGDMVVAQDAVPASMFEMADGTLEKLPFRLQLASVDTVYSKNGTPCDYRVHILASWERKSESEKGKTCTDGIKECAQHTVSLNAPVKIGGYQLCIKGVQEEGVSLLVSYDPLGRMVSYLGYAMVFISFLLLSFDRKSGFNALLYKLKVKGVRHKVEEKYWNGWGEMWGVLLCVPMLLCVLWCERGVFPATNGIEALMLLAVFVTLFAVALRRTKHLALLKRVLPVVAIIIFAVAAWNFDVDVDVQPILRTPLLGIHVTTIIIAYALLACTAVNAVIALCLKDEKIRKQQALLGRLLLYPATMLLAGGIFIGAVWANLSWGRYWGWDPKEVWALVTLLVCSVGFHSHSLRFISKPVAFHVFCIVAFMAVLFTFFGVNYLLGGLHSYA